MIAGYVGCYNSPPRFRHLISPGCLATELRHCFFGLFFTPEKLVGLLDRFRRPLSFVLLLLEMIELFYADNGPALGEPAAAHEGAFLALPDDQLAAFAFVALNAGRLCGRFRGQDVAFFV